MKATAFFSFLFVLFTSLPSFGQAPLSKGDHFADINGIKLHYYVSGEGPVCLVPTPGWGPSLNYLKKSLTPLERLFTIVYYDTRISGESSGPEDPKQYTSENFMNDMDGLRVYLNLSKVWIMGHSMGGFQVLNYGIHHSAHLNGIIALAPMAGRDSIYQTEFTKMVERRKGLPFYEAGSALFFGKDTSKIKNSEIMPYIFPFYFHDVQKIAEFQKLGDPGISDKAGEFTEASSFGSEYLFPKLNTIKVPTLIVVGDDDFICDKVSQADRIKAQIPNCEEIIISEAGHFSWIEQPEQFFTEVEKWIKKQNLSNH